MESIIKEIEEIQATEEVYLSKITLNDPLKEKILLQINEISKNLDLASDYATIFAIQKAEKYYNRATKQFEKLKDSKEFVEGYKKIQERLTIQKEAKETLAEIKKSVEYIKRFIENSPTLSQSLDLEIQLETHESIFSELENALVKEQYEQVINQGKSVDTKEEIDERILLFLKDLYKNAQQSTARIQEILKDFDILKFSISKEHSGEIEKALLKGRALIDAKKFEDAFVALCDCLNLNKTALNTIVNSTESLLKELNCNSIQSSVEILTSKYNFTRESVLKMIFRLVLLQRLEIDGKFIWSKEDKYLELQAFSDE
jgi:hypothetical protein